MQRPKVDYDKLAARFDARYKGQNHTGSLIGETLRGLAPAGSRVLEVGCGTGRWLSEFGDSIVRGGMDLSFEMLRHAKDKGLAACLVQGDAAALPFRDQSLDLVYAVHALHHFSNPRRFICSAVDLLRDGGYLAVVAIDPRHLRNRWFIYQYFEGTWELDLARYPSRKQVREWMQEAGLASLEERTVETVSASRTGTRILDDPFLQQDQISQLALLSEEDYQLGLEKIRKAAESGAVFHVELESTITIGRRPSAGSREFAR